jgi:16S rRNA (guanine527-N7)-methyltransferase
MAAEIEAVLTDRSRCAGLVVDERLAQALIAYYRILERWNRTINLTSLSDPAVAVDRLLLEPLAAARRLPEGASLMDLGSGGGSPAVPLALALGTRRLVMVESRLRKAAFLREVVRELRLGAVVESVRFEDLVAHGDYEGQMDVVSVRAVKVDENALKYAISFLGPGGQVALFHTLNGADRLVPDGLVRVESAQLLESTKSQLTLLRKS